MSDTGITGRRSPTGLCCTAAAAALALVMAGAVSASTETVPDPAAQLADEEASGHAGGGSPLFLELPPGSGHQPQDRVRLTGASPPANLAADRQPLGSSPALAGIPATVLDAYQRATVRLGEEQPACGVAVPLLAAIGRVESNHARDGALDRAGRAQPPIFGPQLNGGPGVATIYDTDGGRLDGDPVYDRAVGPMQFIPSTWARWGADANGDGTADPQNIFDSTLAAARYLCAAGGDLTTDIGLHRAIRAYNRPDQYLQAVLSWMRVYAGGAIALPDSAPSDAQQPPPEGQDTPRSAASGDDQDPEPAGGSSPDPEPGQPAQEPADEPAPSDPVPEGDELLEPVEDLADAVLPDAPGEQPSLFGDPD